MKLKYRAPDILTPAYVAPVVLIICWLLGWLSFFQCLALLLLISANFEYSAKRILIPAPDPSSVYDTHPGSQQTIMVSFAHQTYRAAYQAVVHSAPDGVGALYAALEQAALQADHDGTTAKLVMTGPAGTYTAAGPRTETAWLHPYVVGFMIMEVKNPGDD